MRLNSSFVFVLVLCALAAQLSPAYGWDEERSVTDAGQSFFGRVQGRAPLAPSLTLIPEALERASRRLTAGPPPVSPVRHAVRVRVGRAFFDRMLRQKIERTVPASDWILDTLNHGTTRITGQATLSPVPDKRQGTMLFEIRGAAESKTSGRRPPVTIHTQTLTPFRAAAHVHLTQAGHHIERNEVSANSRTRTEAITTSAPILRNLIARNAWRRVERLRPRIDAATSEHNRVRIARHLEEELDEHLARTRKVVAQLQQEFSTMLDLNAMATEYSSTDEYLEIAFVTNARAPDDSTWSPEFVDDADVQLVLHSSTLGQAARSPDTLVRIKELFETQRDVAPGSADVKSRPPESKPRLAWTLEREWFTVTASRTGDPGVAIRR